MVMMQSAPLRPDLGRHALGIAGATVIASVTYGVLIAGLTLANGATVAMTALVAGTMVLGMSILIFPLGAIVFTLAELVTRRLGRRRGLLMALLGALNGAGLAWAGRVGSPSIAVAYTAATAAIGAIAGSAYWQIVAPDRR